MYQVVLEVQQPWPDSGLLHLDAHFDGKVAVSPVLARRRASGFFAGDVTLMALAGVPMLVLGQRPVWRVPGCLHLPGLGQVATIGSVDVDASTGEVLSPSAERIAAMKRHANAIAARLAFPAAPASFTRCSHWNRPAVCRPVSAILQTYSPSPPRSPP